jgi:hypothetical protein
VHDPAARADPRVGRVLDEVVSHREHEVRLRERQSDPVALLDADREQALVGVHVHGALAHERRRHRDAEARREAPQTRGGPRPDRAVPGDDDRGAGRRHEVGGGLDRLRVRDGPPVAKRLERLRRRRLLGDVLGQLDQHGAGLLAAREPHRLAHDLG